LVQGFELEPRIFKNLEELPLLLLVHSAAGILDLSLDDEVAVRRRGHPEVGEDSRAEDVDEYLDGALLVAELAGVAEHVVEDLLVDFDIHFYAELLH